MPRILALRTGLRMHRLSIVVIVIMCIYIYIYSDTVVQTVTQQSVGGF